MNHSSLLRVGCGRTPRDSARALKRATVAPPLAPLLPNLPLLTSSAGPELPLSDSSAPDGLEDSAPLSDAAPLDPLLPDSLSDSSAGPELPDDPDSELPDDPDSAPLDPLLPDSLSDSSAGPE